QRLSGRKFASNWRMLASTGDDVASPRLAIFKNVAQRQHAE
ncbi:hypothetical protein A2U01_0078992, partial [Trifolium medium]|nr:hypothetical protein [Trifolium medium]